MKSNFRYNIGYGDPSKLTPRGPRLDFVEACTCCDCRLLALEEYRRPFLEVGDDRWPTLQWAREVPLSGKPSDVHDRIGAYSTWLKTVPLPKLCIDAEPGVFITGRIRRLASSFPNQHRVVVRGLHFVQEDSPDEIALAIAGWLERSLTDPCLDASRRNRRAVG